MYMRISISFLFVLLLLAGCSSSGHRYYFSPATGDDRNDGLSEQNPFRTLSRARTLYLKPGDAILLAAGEVFNDSLILENLNGRPGKEIAISSYGGERAIIMADKGTAIKIKGGSHVVVKNIRVEGAGRLKGNAGSGVDLHEVHYAAIDSLEAEGFGWCGVRVTGGSHISITHVYAHDNGFAGINVESGGRDCAGLPCSGTKSVYDVYIGYCTAENNPGSPMVLNNHSGNGILLGGVTRGVIEYCEAMNNGWDMPREGNGPVGIWTYMSDSIVIQYCYSHHNKTSPTGADGGGFDLDGGVTNSVVRWNLSAFNEGGGYGLFQYAGATEWNNNTIYCNISYLDGKKNGKAGVFVWCDPYAIPMGTAYVFNNTVINDAGYGCNFQPGSYRGMLFYNNIFLMISGEKRMAGGDSLTSTFRHNLYWSQWHQSRNLRQPDASFDREALIADPLLNLPSQGDSLKMDVRFLKDIAWFRPAPGSPVCNAGVNLPGPFPDFTGSVPAIGTKPSLGAFLCKIKE